MNEKTRSVLGDLSATQEAGADWERLSADQHPTSVMRGLDGIRRWLQIPDLLRSQRPSAEFLRVILGHGRAGALRIIEEFCAETQRTAEEARATLSAVATIAGRARSTGLISWDLNDVKPEGRPRILVAFDEALDARLREAALARSESLSDFIREAVRDRVATIEKPRRAASAGGAGEGAPAA